MPLLHVKTLSELVGLIDEIGMSLFFLPDFGFSVAEITDSRVWWTDDPE